MCFSIKLLTIPGTLVNTEDGLLDKNDVSDQNKYILITKDRTKLTPTKHE